MWMRCTGLLLRSPFRVLRSLPSAFHLLQSLLLLSQVAQSLLPPQMLSLSFAHAWKWPSRPSVFQCDTHSCYHWAVFPGTLGKYQISLNSFVRFAWFCCPEHGGDNDAEVAVASHSQMPLFIWWMEVLTHHTLKRYLEGLTALNGSSQRDAIPLSSLLGLCTHFWLHSCRLHGLMTLMWCHKVHLHFRDFGKAMLWNI